MDVLIKGMEMPTRCEDCFCYRHNAEYDYAYCNISSVKVRGKGNARFNNCPLVPVPTPHGRLGDLDRLESNLRNMAKYQSGYRQQGILGCCETIRLAPTIIPPEDGE